MQVAEREATAAHMSGRQQKSARTKGRARWEVVVREVQRGDLRTTYALSSEAYDAQRSACDKAYRAEADARRAAGGEAPSDLYTDVEGEYKAITCGWTACSGHAARDFKLLVGCIRHLVDIYRYLKISVIKSRRCGILTFKHNGTEDFIITEPK